MPKIHIVLKKVESSGAVPVEGKVRLQPVSRIKTGTTMIVPEYFEQSLDSDGVTDVSLPKMSSAQVWAVTELPGTAQEYTRYVQIPASEETINYTDLPDVNPASGVPVSMQNGQVLQVMVASSAQAAAALSAKYPHVLVVYPSDTTTATSVSSVGPVLSSAGTAVSGGSATLLPDTVVAVGGTTLESTADDDTDDVASADKEA
ncbi:hypothetical protein [Bifidobacterium cuniculi]|uniref:Uncharacterized protein n=1 Tax=Bifidobacterium cuniculi TaxID=1688 RepID=A0A087B416_9BIFI|nr:hypothetical protein [Bifidobacterium cuniculi]KFI65766.1 hypothetical protein BCUN_0261 [Bifidobacterium cuniculi]